MIAELTSRAEVIFNHVSDAIVVTDDRLCIIEANIAFEQLFGYQTHDIAHQLIHKLVSPKQLHIFSNLLEDIHTQKNTKRLETIAIRKDGSTFLAEISLTLIESPELTGYVCTIRDISVAQQKLATLKIRESRTRAILDASPVCIMSIDTHGNFVAFNSAAERTFGYTREDVIGKPMVDLIMPDSFQKAHHDGMQRFLSTRQSKVMYQPMRVPARRADGSEFLMEITIAPIETDNQLFFTAYIRDLSDEHQPIKDSTGKLRSLDELL